MEMVTRMALGLWGSDDGDGHEGGVMGGSFCEEVHPVLPNRSNTIHERTLGKIKLYTRFFDFANFRLPLSTFLVDILRYFCINISQLSVIGAAKFACPARFPWHTAKNVTRDLAPVADDFNAQDYDTLVAHPSPLWKFLEELLCLVGLSRHYTLDEETYPSFVEKDGEDMDIFAFIRTTDPTKSELDASVDKLFDEGGSGTQVEQGDSTGAKTSREKKNIVSDDGGPLHPPKRLREDHGTPNGASVGRKSRSAVQRLFARAVHNAEVRGEPLPTLPFVTSSVSAMPEREDEGHTDSVTGLNLRTISAS
ncbi:hypothetical protein Tco_0478765 [Tanacetum coccineum]